MYVVKLSYKARDLGLMIIFDHHAFKMMWILFCSFTKLVSCCRNAGYFWICLLHGSVSFWWWTSGSPSFVLRFSLFNIFDADHISMCMTVWYIIIHSIFLGNFKLFCCCLAFQTYGFSMENWKLQNFVAFIYQLKKVTELCVME